MLVLAGPNLKTAEACAAAIDKLGAPITAGAIGASEAKLLLELVQTRLKAIEVRDLEARLAERERTAATVDTGGRR